MKNFLAYIALVYCVLALQSVFVGNIKPDLVLVLVCVYALKYSYMKSMAFGAMSGLIVDAASGFVLGPNIISKLIVVFLSRTVRDNIYNWNILSNTLLVTVLSIVDVFAVHVCHEAFSGVSFTNRSWTVSLWGVVFTVGAAMLSYGLLKPERGADRGTDA